MQIVNGKRKKSFLKREGEGIVWQNATDWKKV